MKIDPSAWMYIVPALVVMLWLYIQPADHIVKRWWREMRRCEAMGWERLGVSSMPDAESARDGAVLFWFAVSALSTVSVASLAAFFGLL